jgi:hypothetical protein
MRKWIQERVNELVKTLDDAATIPDKFARDFDRSRLPDEIR